MSMKNKLVGGKSDNMSIKDIADKFDVPTSQIKNQIKKGLEVEKEHTNDIEKAKEVAMDHLTELPNYYDELNKMEKKASKDIKPSEVNETTKNLIRRLIRENFNDIFKKLKIENKNTLPKIPSDNVFKNKVTNIDKLIQIINVEKIKEKPIEIINLDKIVPTQKFLDINNLKEVENVGYNTGAELIKYNDLYYIVDGHHRIGIEILKGNDSVKAFVYHLK